MRYETPQLVAHGTIAEHTFGVSAPTPFCESLSADPPKDHNQCKTDCFGEWSCS